MIRILVMCSGNSIRSQIAEGYFSHFGKGIIEVKSAGIHATYVHPLAIQVMQEKLIDISQHISTDFRDIVEQEFDYVITLSEGAMKHCKAFPSRFGNAHWDVIDPTSENGSIKDIMKSFRKVRDSIEERVLEFITKNEIKIDKRNSASIR